jgi:hypothetical protein
MVHYTKEVHPFIHELHHFIACALYRMKLHSSITTSLPGLVLPQPSEGSFPHGSPSFFYQQIHQLDEHSSSALRHSALSLTDLDINEFGSHPIPRVWCISLSQDNTDNDLSSPTLGACTAASLASVCGPGCTSIINAAQPMPSAASGQAKIKYSLTAAQQPPNRLQCKSADLDVVGTMPAITIIDTLGHAPANRYKKIYEPRRRATVFHRHHHLSHNPSNPSTLDTQILSTAMSKFLACAPASSPIYSLALSTPLHCLRPPLHEAAFLLHHPCSPRPPSTSEGLLPRRSGIFGSPPFRLCNRAGFQGHF